MSRIKIIGNSSGTGDFTLTSPNSNTSRTLTLPDETGTVLSSGGAIDVNASAPADSIVIDSSGNVGIGTSSPTGKLNVVTNNTHNGGVTFDSTGTTQLWLRDTDATSNQRNWGFQISGGSLNILRANDDRASGFVTPIEIQQAPANSLVIDSSGQVGIGVSPYAPLTVAYSKASDTVADIRNTSSTSPYGLRVGLTGATPNNASQYFITCPDSTNTKATLYSNGGLANYQANNTNLSDAREKTDLEDSKNYLDVICSIPVKTFLYIDQTDEDRTLGVIAQDVQEVAPELVSEDDWGTPENPKVRLGIYQTDFQYALMKSIQELKTLVDTQQQTIESLKSRLDAAGL